MFGIELRLFHYFVAVAEEQHFSRAAERLGITPPTLTHQIQKLERHLGVRLCDRKPKTRVTLTEPGKRFLEHARQVLRQAEEAELAVHRAARGEVGRIEIGYVLSASCAGLIQKLVGGFQRAYPAIEINLRRMETLGQLNALTRNEIDIGFARPPHQYPAGLRGFVVLGQPMALALPANHPLARRRKPISPHDLKDEKFITPTLEVDLGFPLYTEAVTGPANFAPTVVKRVQDMFTVLTYVSAGYGIAVITESLGRIALPNLAIRKLAAPAAPSSPLACIHRRNESAPAVSAFIRAMSRHKLEV